MRVQGEDVGVGRGEDQKRRRSSTCEDVRESKRATDEVHGGKSGGESDKRGRVVKECVMSARGDLSKCWSECQCGCAKDPDCTFMCEGEGEGEGR
eukprot:2434719-Pleurochrysis_carterae.AAC.2